MRALAALAAILPAACDGTSTSASPKSKEIANGTSFFASDYKIPGHVVVLEFYADW